MAYMNQEKKAKIAAALKLVMPKDWKYTLSVHNHSSITMTVKSAPIPAGDVIVYESGSRYDTGFTVENLKNHQLNTYYPQNVFSGKTLEIVQKAIEALNTDNFDKSDIQTDYFHVGHYAYLHFGKYNKPFINTAV